MSDDKGLSALTEHGDGVGRSSSIATSPCGKVTARVCFLSNPFLLISFCLPAQESCEETRNVFANTKTSH
jgi:hypothetical protein